LSRGVVFSVVGNRVPGSVAENPVWKGLANHWYSALEGNRQPDSLSVGRGANGPKAIAEGVGPLSERVASHWPPPPAYHRAAGLGEVKSQQRRRGRPSPQTL